MKLTAEQLDASRCDENLMLTACPGSGKTRVIVSKLSRVVEDVRDTPRAVACITYTNAAVHEIEARLLHHIQPGDDAHYDICTIHSFCLHHIFRPFCHLIRGYKDGFRVLTPDSADFEELVKATCAQFGRDRLNFQDFDEFSQLRVGIDGSAVGPALTRGALTPEMAREYWKRVREAGLVDFANILYYSYLLLQRRTEILSYISAKFAWILVDEFQDTTDIQVEILTLVAQAGQTRFLLVGDPYQSVFGFAGARPDLADVFAKRIHARSDKQLTGNFRCSKPIVAHANLLYPRTPPMTAVGPTRNVTIQPVWKSSASAFNVIIDFFLPALEGRSIPIGDAAILAPTWYSLFPLGRRLREYGVSIVGPGARPYRRNRVFAPLAEQVCGYMMELNPQSLGAIERSLFHTILSATGRVHFEVYSYAGRAVVFRLLGCAQSLYEKHEGAVLWLESAAREFSKILIEAGYLAPAERDLFMMAVEEMKADMRNNDVDLANLAIEDLGIYASPGSALKLSSLHNAKGREFRAVAIMDLNEGRIPHYRATSAGEIDEAKRLFYVGVTRAKEYLLYITDSSNSRNGPSRFLKKASGVGVC
ncbi:hypothetical protein FRZ61_42980 [Hypericibacter adhaerens]|jgi:DNA helicase-2/ATP-dependent DNA helicase PcrA|uniref:DNA 3'-5' helicase n=1 Tax=Hypericibacter adhaerens TaxID=2602016 RepID=A0A5J6N4K7_9PROT|nr:ATP-dependent helicase [Hypericibacter adhaerens]QEX24357.1 hypothetical protein FRZ61_42980 [Hypericibacter adhaerens]